MSETEGLMTYNFYGDINVVLGGNQNDIAAMSIEPSVAEKVIDAVKEVVMMFGGQQRDGTDDATVMDWLAGQDQEFWSDVLGEVMASEEEGGAVPEGEFEEKYDEMDNNAAGWSTGKA